MIIFYAVAASMLKLVYFYKLYLKVTDYTPRVL